MITFSVIYFLVPRLWHRERLYSLRMVNWHFWLATTGIVFYAGSMWVAGITQGLMWAEYDPATGYLVNSFADTTAALWGMYVLRALGGVLYLAGAVLLVINVWRTILGHRREEVPLRSATYDEAADRPVTAVPAE
jgi:cytochrome c oxidase cbb3-type subunit 1